MLVSSAAPAAAAGQGVLTADSPITIDASETAGIPNAWTAFGGETKCPGSTYTGHAYFSTPHKSIPSGTSLMTVTPHYNQSECVSSSGGSSFSATVDVNGCDFELQIGSTWGIISDGTFAANLRPTCPPNQSIQLTQFSGEAHGFRICTVKIPPQFTSYQLHITESLSGHLTLRGTITGMSAERSGLCGANSTTQAELHVAWTLAATNELGKSTPLSVSH